MCWKQIRVVYWNFSRNGWIVLMRNAWTAKACIHWEFKRVRRDLTESYWISWGVLTESIWRKRFILWGNLELVKDLKRWPIIDRDCLSYGIKYSEPFPPLFFFKDNFDGTLIRNVGEAKLSKVELRFHLISLNLEGETGKTHGS